VKKQRPVTLPAWPSPRVPRAIRYRERFEFALALSLSIHALILALRFGAAGFGLPWAEEREPGLQLTIRLTEASRPPEPAPASAPVPPAVALRTSPELATGRQPKPETRARADTTLEVRLVPRAVEAVPPPMPLSAPRRVTSAPSPAARARARDRKIQPKPRPQILAQSAPRQDTFKVPPPKPVEPEQQRAPESNAKKQAEETPPAEQSAEQTERRHAEEAARLQAEESARQRAEEDARQRAIAAEKALDAKKQAEARRLEDARKQEEARKQALELEARKRAEEAARKEAEELARQRAVALQKEQQAKKLEDASRVEEARKLEAARIQEELKKQEEGRRITLEMEALKRAEALAKQQDAARRKEQEAKRQAEEATARAKETEQREMEAQAAGQRERLAAQQGPAPGAPSGAELAAKALDQLRNPGTARGDPARPPSQSPSAERRRALFGIERDVGLRMYVDSWRWKIERNGALNYRASAAWRTHENPIVTVSIRSDGSLEDVWIHKSSGVRELDAAVLRIARSLAPYSAFPPPLARQYDVIEIRRVWSFENTLKILDEM
jgi:TonB family protein